MARQASQSPLAYLAHGARTAIRLWARRDRRAIERWPASDVPDHWRDIEPTSGERQSFAVCSIHGDHHTLVGRITLRDMREGSARIGIVVHPAHRGRGIGSDALTTICRVVRPELTQLVLDVALDNTAAIRCYRKAGWREIGLVNYRNGHAYLDMGRTLC
jgi:RimJ/RimL family protein N-acetyltransferase